MHHFANAVELCSGLLRVDAESRFHKESGFTKNEVRSRWGIAQRALLSKFALTAPATINFWKAQFTEAVCRSAGRAVLGF